MATYSNAVNRHQWHPRLTAYIRKRDGAKCIYCGAPAVAIDHVVPFSQGGPTRKENGVCICRPCNLHKKGNMTQDFTTRAIFWLLSVGEDMSWTDDFAPEHRYNRVPSERSRHLGLPRKAKGAK